MRLTVAEIAEACGGRLICVPEGMDYDTPVTGVEIDSRRVETGGVFLATVGERVDGHRFISQVFAGGAALAVTEKTPEQVTEESGEDCSGWGCCVLVENSLQALKDIAEAYRRKLSLRVIGITGSVGKTSTKEVIAAVLSRKYRVLKTEGNFNNEVGVPLTLLRIREEHQVAVVEMGISDFGEMHRLSRMVRPDVCVITNIGQCHLENLKSRDGILKAKSEIFDFMAQDGEVCLNGGDDKLRGLQEVRGRRPHFFGLCGEAEQAVPEVKADEVVSHGLMGSDAVLKITDGGGKEHCLLIHVPLPGRHMVLNAAAAACVARLLGLDEAQIAAGIASLEPVSGRNHLIELSDYTLIDDCYNANPASMRAALDLLGLADTKKVAILGDMFELGENSARLHREIGSYAAEKGTDVLLFVGELAEHSFQAAAEHAETTAHIAHFPTRDALLSCLEQNREEYIPNGSTVLIKASHGMAFDKILEFLEKHQEEKCSSFSSK